jgi:hypothetical protein
MLQFVECRQHINSSVKHLALTAGEALGILGKHLGDTSLFFDNVPAQESRRTRNKSKPKKQREDRPEATRDISEHGAPR